MDSYLTLTNNLSSMIEKKTKLLSALSKVKLDNALFLKDDARERGKEYVASEKMLASVQKPFQDHKIVIQLLSTHFEASEDYETVNGYKGERQIKEIKVKCLFSASEITSGQTLVYEQETIGIADAQTSAADAIASAKTRCMGSFIQGLLMIPKLSRNDFGKTKETLETQKRISEANKQVKLRMEHQEESKFKEMRHHDSRN